METNQQHTNIPPQAIPPYNLPPTIFGISTKDALTVCMGVAMAAMGINKIINSKKNGC